MHLRKWQEGEWKHTQSESHMPACNHFHCSPLLLLCRHSAVLKRQPRQSTLDLQKRNYPCSIFARLSEPNYAPVAFIEIQFRLRPIVALAGESNIHSSLPGWHRPKSSFLLSIEQRLRRRLDPTALATENKRGMERESESEPARKSPRNLGRFYEGTWYCDCAEDCLAIHKPAGRATENAGKWCR